MIRFTKALALAATLLAIPSMASALGIEVVQATDDATGNANNGTLAVGAAVTFDIRMTFTGTEPQIFGLSADLTGMDLADATGARELGLQLGASGNVVAESLGIDPVGDGSVISGAIANNNGTRAVERFSINHLNPQAYTVNMFDGIRRCRRGWRWPDRLRYSGAASSRVATSTSRSRSKTCSRVRTKAPSRTCSSRFSLWTSRETRSPRPATPSR